MQTNVCNVYERVCFIFSVLQLLNIKMSKDVKRDVIKKNQSI